MKLDVNALRYLSKEEFRTLQAVELGQKNVRSEAQLAKQKCSAVSVARFELIGSQGAVRVTVRVAVQH